MWACSRTHAASAAARPVTGGQSASTVANTPPGRRIRATSASVAAGSIQCIACTATHDVDAARRRGPVASLDAGPVLDARRAVGDRDGAHVVVRLDADDPSGPAGRPARRQPGAAAEVDDDWSRRAGVAGEQRTEPRPAPTGGGRRRGRRSREKRARNGPSGAGPASGHDADPMEPAAPRPTPGGTGLGQPGAGGTTRHRSARGRRRRRCVAGAAGVVGAGGRRVAVTTGRPAGDRGAVGRRRRGRRRRGRRVVRVGPVPEAGLRAVLLGLLHAVPDEDLLALARRG